MKWFEGSISEAVAATKSRKAIFVVFIEGKDDESSQVAQAMNETEVSSRLERENFVAIKLESGSDSYRFFAEMYQLVPVPSIFFIDNGIPMEIVAGKTTASELAVKIDGLLKKVNTNSSLNLIDAEQKIASASSSGSGASSSSHSKIVDKVPEEARPVSNKDHKTEEPMTVEMKMEDAPLPSDTEQKMEVEQQNSEIQDNKIHLTTEEKLERAKKLMELQKKQRQEEEERKLRERELERRKVGRDVQKMRQKQQDLEMKLALEERTKERVAEAAAREKVRQQIAQDKLERKQREMTLQQTQQQQQQSTSQPEAPKAVVSDASVTRIQFRLPSGNPHMGQFEPMSTLGALRNYVAENINLPFRHFSMSTSFPRRELNTEDDNKTLLELELVPTAVILILPMRSPNATSVTSTQDVGFLSQLMWTIFAPIIGVFNLVMGYFSGGRQTTSREPSQNDASANSVPADSNVATSTSTTSSHFSNIPYTSGLIRRNFNSQGGSTIRTQGNIHRLHSGGEDNDENNTWNGNSTQQM